MLKKIEIDFYIIYNNCETHKGSTGTASLVSSCTWLRMTGFISLILSDYYPP